MVEAHGAQARVGARDTANQLRIAVSAFRRRAKEAVADGELSGPQVIALSRIDRFGPMTTAALARREQISPQAMGATITGLEQLGLLARSADEADARRSILSLTPAGLEALRSGRNAVADRVAAILEGSFTEAEIDLLAAAAPLIERIADQL